MQAKHTRREFMKGASHIGTLSFFPASVLVRPSIAAADVNPEAIQKLALRLQGRLITPSSDAYDESRRVNIWNPTLSI
jgi:hypothetical protein